MKNESCLHKNKIKKIISTWNTWHQPLFQNRLCASRKWSIVTSQGPHWGFPFFYFILSWLTIMESVLTILECSLNYSNSSKVASRVQKYFIKLAKAGLPVPGRVPNIPRLGTRVREKTWFMFQFFRFNGLFILFISCVLITMVIASQSKCKSLLKRNENILEITLLICEEWVLITLAWYHLFLE